MKLKGQFLSIQMRYCNKYPPLKLCQTGVSQQSISVKGWRVNIFSFADYMVSVTTNQNCYCSVKAVVNNMQVNGHSYAPIKPYLLKQAADLIWPLGCNLLTPVLKILIVLKILKILKDSEPGVWLSWLEHCPCKLESGGFDSYLGHMPVFQVQTPVRAHLRGNQSKFLSLFLPPSLLSKIHKHVLR